MAPGDKPAMNGGGEPPPSTLAAQIVENFENSRNPSTAGTARARLQELLQMILEGKDASASQRAIADNFDENYRLINVIVKACLEPLCNEDPFGALERLRGQSRDSLAVIDLTIRRSPEVLFVPPSRPVSATAPGGPLFLWLIPQLINLLRHTDEIEIKEGAEKVLRTALWAQVRPAACKTRRQPVLKLIQGCIRDLHSYTTARAKSSLDPSGFTIEHVPTNDTLSEAWGDAFQSPRDTSCVQFKDLSRNTLLISRLLFLLAFPISSPTQVKIRSNIDYAWILDQVNSLWSTVNSLGNAHRPVLPHVWTISLQETLRKVLSDLSTSKYEIVTCARAAIILCKLTGAGIQTLIDSHDTSLQNAASWSIASLISNGYKSPHILQLYYEHLDPQIERLVASSDILASFDKDFQRVLVLASHIARQFTDPNTGKVDKEILDFSNTDLRQTFADLVRDAETSPLAKDNMANRSTKRSCNLGFVEAMHDPKTTVYERLQKRLYTMMDVPIDESYDALKLAVENIKLQGGDDQCAFFNVIGETACADADSLLDSEKCPYCDCLGENVSNKRLMELEISNKLYDSVVGLVIGQRNIRPRVTAMLALKRILAHSSNPDHFDLRQSTLGQWCCVSLKSSSRDLRLATIQTLMSFVDDDLNSQFKGRNRKIVLDNFRVLAEKNEPTLQETCILGFGHFASCTSNEEEINIILQRLVEYLGHTNPLISGLACEELQKLSSHDSYQAKQMFEPYWRTIADKTVRNLQKRPQMIQSLCDIIGIHVSEFLRRTQFYTIPYLIQSKQRDVLQRIATASGPEETIFTICISRAQLAAILAYLLIQPSTDSEKMVMSLLVEACPEFANHDLPALLKSNAIFTAFELLKVAGEEGTTDSARAHQVIIFLAEHTQRKPSSSRNSSGKKTTVLSMFFETWALAIVQLLSDIIGQVKASQPVFERRRCIGAIKQMAILAEDRLSYALPQVCSCLRSAIEDEKLCNEAFSAWMTLLQTLDEESIIGLVDPTFAIIVQNWHSFDFRTQQQAHDMIADLFKNHPDIIRESIETIPSIASIQLLSKFEADMEKLKAEMNPRRQFKAFCKRIRSENTTVVTSALKELESYLLKKQTFVQTSAVSEQPEPIIGEVIRSVLDACVRFKDSSQDIALLCATCLGLIGCVDPTRVEIAREDPQMFVLSNFQVGMETVEFILFFLQEVVVKAYLATTVTSRQQLLAFGMQEFLNICDLTPSVTHGHSPSDIYRKWIQLPESTRNILQPFQTSKYSINPPVPQPERIYPIYRSGSEHAQWLRYFTLDLLQKGQGENAKLVFSICIRLVRNQDLAIASFLIPYVVLNIIVEGTDSQRSDIVRELYTVLAQPLEVMDQIGRENLIASSQIVFKVIDYLSRWIQEKSKVVTKRRQDQQRIDEAELLNVATVIKKIPPKVISSRAVECKSFARALFYWEQYIREQGIEGSIERNGTELYAQLQEIYMQIDEPDGIEGITYQMVALGIGGMGERVLEDKKAGRWTAVQNWYEVQLAKRPADLDVQMNLLTSLKESGQHDLLLNQVATLHTSKQSLSMRRPFAVEAAWVTGKWDKLTEFCEESTSQDDENFNIGIGKAISSLHEKNYPRAHQIAEQLLLEGTRTLSASTTASLQECHDTMLRFHVLVELKALAGVEEDGNTSGALHKKLTGVQVQEQRLEAIGAFSSHKQYLLGIRRAVMQLSDLSERSEYGDLQVSSTWIASARLARKADYIHQAFNAVHHASQLGDSSAPIEHAKLVWKEGHHRKAIQSLLTATQTGEFTSMEGILMDGKEPHQQRSEQRQSMVPARAQLLLAKWIDGAGQTQSNTIIKYYNAVTTMQRRWEKGHYYLGKHYNKLLESEKVNAPDKQAQTYHSGEMAKLVIENFLRSLPFGTKYIYLTLPKLLTLWLDLGAQVDKPLDPKIGDEKFRQHTFTQRKKLVSYALAQVKKYLDRLPAFVFYTAFAQIVARICHPNPQVAEVLVDIVAKVVAYHPQQAMWPLLAMIKSRSSPERARRGVLCKGRSLEYAKKQGRDTPYIELQNLLNQGSRLSDQLLDICNKNFDGGNMPRGPVSLSKEVGFNHARASPCRLAIPIEATLLATLPPITESVKTHRAFSKDTVTIQVFLDEFTVMNSLARPRKVKIRGSDGKVYTILCKPKDDLRKDQRLLEFNSMISRTLKKDANCSKRRLYIKTYAVTPLNEDHGLIEWVEGMRTLRDIMLERYKARGITVNYNDIAGRLKGSAHDPSLQKKTFEVDTLGQYPPVLHEWFVNMFPEPGAWFAARLRYTRSCAVMSMVGHVLGLGDRHGENILLEEGQGGTFHVDFNCLFDKGKTFDAPELVPFRLTHNMVDAFGVYRENGPFRRSCELTLGILRQYEDTLMTILETFLYDPTTDFIGKPKRKAQAVVNEVPDTPAGVLESVRKKVRRLLPKESLPLSAEGYVALLIEQARDPLNLANMYIGWLSFF